MPDRRQKFRPGEIQEIILEKIANFLIDLGGYPKGRINVILGELIKIILKERRRLTRTQIRRSLEHLEKREILDLKKVDNEVLVNVKEKGRVLVLTYSIKSLLDLKREEKKWNGKWYLVFFDVPEIQRNKRDYLRNFLKKIGFYCYQKSVYVFPFKCEEEIKLIKKIVEGAKYMKYVVAEKIEDEEALKAFFKI